MTTTSTPKFLQFILLPFFVLALNIVWGQPFIRTTGGYGQYGYVEKDATATNFLVGNGGYGNIYNYGVRTYLAGPNSNNHNYMTNSPGGCARGDEATSNFSPTLAAGNIMYSSVFVEYCGPSYSCGGSMTPNQACFNERDFFVMDVVGRTDAVVGTINYATGTNVVLSFTISNNNTSGQALNRLWIQNDGTATEGTDIVATNGAFRVYYEAATGSETFNGTESYGELYGNYNSNSTSNNIYGNDALNISIPQNSTGGLRVYVVLMGSSTYLNSSAIGKTVRANVIADGISITPNRNTSFSLMKMDLLRPSSSYISIAATSFYSKSTGNLELTSSWGTSTDGSGSEPLNFTSGSSTFNIRNNATPTIGASWTVSGTGSKIVVGDGTNACNFTVPSTFTVTSPATDVSNNGTITRTTSGANSWGTLTFASGATYVHNASLGTLPTATWNANSTLQIDANLAADQFTQSFGNVTVNGTAAFFISTTNATYTGSIAGNFTHNSSGAISLKNSSWDATFTIGGNLSITGGGTFRIMESTGGSSTRNQKVIVNGNFSLSNGTLNLSNETSGTVTASSVFALLEVKGNFTHTGGTISETATDADVVTRISLTGTTGTQTLESTGQSNSIDFNVAGSNAQCVVSATKTFTLSSGSTMTIGAGTSNPDFLISGSFLNQSSTSLTVTSATIGVQSGGNYICNHPNSASIATPLGVTTFNSGSTMTYRGSSTLTPNLSLSGRTYHNLIIESTSGSLSLAGIGTSSLIINGDLTIGANCTFGPNVTAAPGHSIKGNITIGAGGTLNYSPATAGTINLNGSGTQTISGSGTFTTGLNATLVVGSASTIDFGATNAIAGTGTFTTSSGSTLITANTSGINGSLTLTNKTLNAGTNYTFNGTSAQVTGAAVTSAANLTLNNTAGLTLSANTAVTGTQTLTNGKVTTNGKTLTLSNAVSGASSSNYIVADAAGTATFNGITTARLLPIGTATSYAPMTVAAASSTNYTAYVTGTLPCSATDATKVVNLAWGLNGSNTPSSVIFQWNAGNQAASFTPGSSCELGRYATACPYTVTSIGTPSGSGPYTLTASSGLSSGSNLYVIGNTNAVYLAPPTVTTTVAASSITHNSASSGGQTLAGGGITAKGVVWNTATAPTVSLSTKTNDGSGTADFNSSLSSLTSETLYYVRAFATNAAGTGYGDEKTFRTLSAPATVQASGFSATATSASNIDLSWTGATFPSSGATAKGYILLRATSPYTPSLGNSNGAAPSAGANTTIVSSSIASNATSFSNSGLASSTQYNYLLVPYTWDGTNAVTYNYLTSSAPTANATTQAGSTAPVLTTNASTSITNNAATLNGEVTSDGGSSVTERGFVYSTSDATPTIGEAGVTQQTVSGTTGVYSYNASSLSANTTYYVQAYATNSSGTTYGGVDQFTTLKNEPTAQATSAVFSSITTSSFNLAFTAATGSPDGYVVIRSTAASLSANPVDGTTYSAGNSLGGGTVVSVGSTISGISNSSLSAGTTYYVYVFSYNNSGSNINYLTTSPLSSSTITLTDAPATPTFSSITTTGFTVDWTSTTGASSYRLDVSTASNFSSYVSGYQDLTVNATSQAVTGLAANTLYYARVRAVNTSGNSANSTSANSATLSNAPSVGAASSITTSGLTASWSPPSSQGGVTITYTIELSTSSSDFSSPVSTVSSIASGTTTNAFTSLTEGTTYYYRIKAVNSAGSSAWSSVSAGATTLTSSISLTALGTAVTENFDAMNSSTSLPSGWRMHASTSTPSWSSASTTVTQQSSSGTPSAGGTYNWGTAASERAIGAMTSSSFASPNQLLVYTKNNTGSTITNFSIAYTAERYRVNTASASIKFYYSTNGSTWSEITDGEITSSNFPTGASSYTFSSPLEIEKSFFITGLNIAASADFYLRWDINTTGSNSQGMGIDDISIKPCGTVSAPTASNQSFCSAASPTVANLTATGTAIQWYAASSGGAALATNTALVNNTTYYVSQTVNGCESISRTAVTATINTNPSIPTGTATQTFCSSASPTVASLTASGTSVQWYAASTGGSPLSTSSALTNNTIYYATQTVSGCESTTRLAVTASLVANGVWLGSTSTDWNTAANWCGGVPTSSTAVTIPSGTSYNPVISAAAAAGSVTINSGATLSFSGTPTLTVSGNFTNNGTFTAGSGTVAFNATATVSGTAAFNNLTLSAALNPGIATTINGTLALNNGGSISTNSPAFGSASTLNYNFGGGFGSRRNQSLEWPSSNGPANLSITNGSWIQLTGSRSLTGDATITNGALQASGGQTLTMNGTSQTITVSTNSGGAIYGTDNGFGNDLSLVIASGSTTTFTGDATISSDDEKKFLGITVNSGGSLVLARGILCKYGSFTVNGTLQINSGGYIQSTYGNAPSYGAASTLKYNSGGSYGRGLEWSATAGAGYPNHVQVSNNSTLNANNGSNTALQMAGNLTIDNGSTMSLEGLTSGSITVGLNVLGNVVNNGTLTLATSTERLKCVNFTNGTNGTTTLSTQVSGDLEVTGNLTDNGLFNSNTRAVFFTGAGTQTIGGTASAPFDFDYVIVDKLSGTVQLQTNLLVGAFTITNGTVNLGSAYHTAGSLTLGSTAQTTGSSYGGTGSAAATVNTTFFAANSGLVNVGTCGSYSLSSTSVAANSCAGSPISVTLSNNNTASLPVGTYTVYYTLTGANTGAFTSTMTVSTAGSGTFDIGTLSNTGATTITINNIRNGCVSAISSNNTATTTVNPVPSVVTLTAPAFCSTGTGTVNTNTSQSGVTYDLFDAGGVIANTSTQGTDGALSWTGLTNGTYYVVGTNNTGGCTSTSSTISLTAITPTYSYYTDADHDNFGAIGSALTPSCSATAPTGYSTSNTDCNDNNASINPGTAEICGDGIDNNCDNQESYPNQYRSRVSSGDWSVASTWDKSCTGGSTWDIALVAPSNQYFNAGNPFAVTVQSGHTVTVSTTSTTNFAKAGSLTVSGNLVVNGNLTVTSSLINSGNITVNHGASFVQTSENTTNSGSGNVTVNMNLTGANNGTAPTGRYWYLGSPLNNTVASLFFDQPKMVRLWIYEPTNNSWVTLINSSTTASGATNSTGLIPGMGYLYRAGYDKTITFTGNTSNLNNNITTPLSFTGSGYKYVSNPYPSHIDWRLVTRTGLNVSYWIRNATNTAYEAYNATSGVSTPTGTQTTQFIPPMQGFWVYAYTTSSSLRMDNGDRTHSTNGLHTPEHNQIVRLNLNDGKTDDQAVVYENDNASNGIEEYDTDKFMDENHHQVYFLEGTKQLTLDGLNNATTKQKVDMGIQITGAGTYTINAVELGVEEDVVLEDKFTHTFQDMKRNNTYSFTSNAGTFNNRFVLHFTLNPQTETAIETETVGVTETEGETEGVSVYTTTGQTVKVWVTNTTDFQNATVKVYDAVGNLIERKNMTSSELLLDLNTATGVYLVEVIGAEKTFTKKIFIEK